MKFYQLDQWYWIIYLNNKLNLLLFKLSGLSVLIGAIIPGTNDYSPPECFNLEGLAYTKVKSHYLDSIKQTLKPDLFLGYVAR